MENNLLLEMMRRSEISTNKVLALTRQAREKRILKAQLETLNKKYQETGEELKELEKEKRKIDDKQLKKYNKKDKLWP